MWSNFNTKAAGLLLVCSIVAVVSHRLGLLDIELPILDASNHVSIGLIQERNLDSHFEWDDVRASSTCTLTNTSGYNFCGISITLGSSPSKGMDLSLYNELEIHVQYLAPIEDLKVRFSFRNYNEFYSNESDSVSLKFNSITYQPNQYNGSIRVPFDAFQVERWWVEQYTVGFNNAQLEFTNVPYIDVITHNMPVKGKYQISIEKAVLYGELISERNLLKAILLIWLIVIILLVTIQRNNLKTISTTDTLTGLLNRRGLSSWVTDNLPSFAKSSPLVMFYFDIDDFKKVNDTHGHVVGDELLCGFCERLKLVATEAITSASKYTFARLAGDEFAFVFKNLDEKQIQSLAEKLIQSLNDPIALSSSDIKVGVSLGVASSDKDINSFERLMGRADSAMYHAKKRGKNQFKIFDDSVSKDIYFRQQVAEKIQTALKTEEFSLNFMPIYGCSSLKICSAEVLLRCDASSLKGIGPETFIPIAEEFGLIQEIDLWVIESTLKKIDENRVFLQQYPLVFCINISSVELHNKHFSRQLKQLIKKYHIDPSWIELEITETSLIETDEQSISLLNNIRELGIKLALDDFGTGYTAFSQLLHYPVDCLKIDKSFIDDIASGNETKATMIKAIISIAKSYKLKTIAEGIESEEQFHFMASHGCDMVQGYLFSKPIKWQELQDLRCHPSSYKIRHLTNDYRSHSKPISDS